MAARALPVLLFAAAALGLVAPRPADATMRRSLQISGFVKLFFSYKPVVHGRVAGYDNSHDGVIDVQQEP